ncbi:MAG: hypothetical protein OEY44_01025, partial [Candidatus Peregrinibacteria bacterium]|nr:hypothetical protein [Candidatus Peregrinibacteria bacterium]
WDQFVGDVKTQLRVMRDLVGPVTPLWNLAIWDTTSATKDVKKVSRCVYYDSQSGNFRNCTQKQEKEYDECRDDREEAIAKGIRCDRFRNTKEAISASQKAAAQLALQEENLQMHREAEQGLIYNLALDSVAENTIYDLDQILWETNKNIQRGYEDVHLAAGPGIPGITRKLEWLWARQCVNKQ